MCPVGFGLSNDNGAPEASMGSWAVCLFVFLYIYKLFFHLFI